ncbi:MAG: DUF3048 domain-containing protein [Candidatus Riflebacteria bacterium]|nr:DUF3048 domain-containing protein [Candidatus Riflebacteria bacterium]
MSNRFVNYLLLIFVLLVASTSYASIEELSGYFEIRDTIQLMNEEMQKGLDYKNVPSLFDEDEIEAKLESFIGFMKNRVSMYAASDSKLRFHYVKKLNTLLEQTSKLLEEAKPLIKAKHETKSDKKEKVVPPVSYATIAHPYFNSIDFRTLASREPLNEDFVTDNELSKESQKATVVAKTSDEKEPSKTAKDKEKESKEKTQSVKAEAKEKTELKAENKITEVKPETQVVPEKKETVVAKDDKASKTEKTSSTTPATSSIVFPAGEYMRPMAIMIENHNQARPQSGLYTADIVYEIPVEGGITRFMALYTKMPGLIGPVRSCREYFVDRALEVDALYVHCGGSPMGYAYIAKTKIRSIDEIKNSPPFFRDKIRKAPHNLYGNGEAIYRYMAKRTDMRVKNQPIPLSYGERTEKGTESGNSLRINYHGNYTLGIKEEKGVYHRYMNNILHLDRETKKPLEASAVVLQVASMKVVDSVGRQEISFIGSGTAWIFENGKRTPVTWHKASPKTKTTYIDNNGKEYLFNNNGQVWVQVVSPSHKIFFEPIKESDQKAKAPAKAQTQTKAKAKAKNETKTKTNAKSKEITKKG